MKLAGNLLAGLTNSVWSALIGLAAVPFYLRYLGVEAYGLIGFFVTTQAVLQLLDMGMAPTINREVARCAATGDMRQAGQLLHTLARVYWLVAAAIALFIVGLASFVAEHWLNSRQLTEDTIARSVMWMGAVVACRWPIGLYQGALIGAQRLTVSSAINMTMVTAGNLGAVGVLAFVSSTIEAFFIWQACVGLIHAFVMRAAAWRIVGHAADTHFDLVQLKRIWRFTAGMSGVGLTALVFTQLDKIILSRMLGLGEFGHYMLGTVVVSGLYVVISPLFNVIYPRFSGLVVTGDTKQLIDFYRLGTQLLASLLFSIATVLALFAEDVILIWTGDPLIAAPVAQIVSLLVIGSALNGVMYFPYALQLAYGMTWIPLIINVALMVFLIPALVYLAQTHGAIGGAMAWVIAEVAYVILGPWLTHRYILKGLAFKWIFRDVGLPLALAILLVVAGQQAILAGEFAPHARVAWAALLALVAAAIGVMASVQLRKALWAYIKYVLKK
ncbi:MAG: oligosaccharide flippase family protein [Hydrogenophaga sp.]|uniref:lipopolysaccharide biosynthesis protein n=1 Tax=Hydrogenophaga sp. TaxID=1904254 RepID=UPI002ABAC8AE|nr:oligosaccharide flippase family protein [Hydrogenophaga sp.]MDZ4101094.1 oligosaccharide flippase family protein [Hydrogenophaga sp.]